MGKKYKKKNDYEHEIKDFLIHLFYLPAFVLLFILYATEVVGGVINIIPLNAGVIILVASFFLVFVEKYLG